MARRGIYRGIYASLFDDPDYQHLSVEARLVLLTARLCQQAGAAAIYRAYVPVLAEQTGLSVHQVEAALGELEKSPTRERPWVFREAGLLWIRNALRFDPTLSLANPKHLTAVERALAALPRSGLVRKFCRYYKIGNPLESHAGGNRYPSVSVSPPSTETDSETENETEAGGGVRGGDAGEVSPRPPPASLSSNKDDRLEKKRGQIEELARANGLSPDELRAQAAQLRGRLGTPRATLGEEWREQPPGDVAL